MGRTWSSSPPTCPTARSPSAPAPATSPATPAGAYARGGKAGPPVSHPAAFPQATLTVALSPGGIRATAFGATGDIPLQGDFDGDGRVDVAIYRPTTGQWFVNRSTAGGE